MVKVTFTAKADTAYGKKLEMPIEFEVTYDAYADYAEVEAARDLFTNEEVVEERNTQRKQKALAAARQAALDAAGIVKPTLENDVLLQLQTVYKVYIAKGKSHEEARALASAAIGEDW